VRIAFFALLFANLVYFAWAHWIDVPRRPPPASESVGRLPQLQLVDELPPSQRRQAGAPEKMALTTTAACLSVGPFGDLANSAQAATLLKAKGFDPRQRAEQGQASDGYWVYVGDLKSQAQAETALVALEREGIRDAVVMPETADAGRRLSLGLYTERSRAERRAQAVQRAGLKAEVAERKLPSTLYWVDLSPPAGMNTIPLEDLFAEGVKSRIAVQPCPPTHGAHEVMATTASNPPPAVAAPAKLP
jgi:hypothetical protein